MNALKILVPKIGTLEAKLTIQEVQRGRLQKLILAPHFKPRAKEKQLHFRIFVQNLHHPRDFRGSEKDKWCKE